MLSHGVGSRTRLIQMWNLVTSDLSFPVCAPTHLRSIPFSWLCGPRSSRYVGKPTLALTHLLLSANTVGPVPRCSQSPTLLGHSRPLSSPQNSLLPLLLPQPGPGVDARGKQPLRVALPTLSTHPSPIPLQPSHFQRSSQTPNTLFLQIPAVGSSQMSYIPIYSSLTKTPLPVLFEDSSLSVPRNCLRTSVSPVFLCRATTATYSLLCCPPHDRALFTTGNTTWPM